jgi:ATP-dependent exoDNAse (exonuclease V) beta subunit
VRLILDENLVIAAGAGSGKTHALVTVALGLYAGAGGRAPEAPSRVWALTFTEKAAAELLGRIAERVRKLARGERDDDLALLLDGKMPGADHWEAIARTLGAAPIGNFHSLCGQLLRRHASEAGIDPRFQILDERVAGEVFEIAREQALHDALAETEEPTRRLVRTLGGLDPTRAALSHLHYKLGEEGRDPPTLVDGSDGKALPPFDRDAAIAGLATAGEALRAQVAVLEKQAHERLAPAAAACRRERIRLAGCTPDRLDEWYPAAVAVAAAFKGRPNKEVRAVWDAWKDAWDNAQAAVARVAQAEAGRELAALLERVEARYTDEKRERGALDFADLVRRARDLLRDDREVRRDAKARVGALLVDEFQDTNRLQLDVCHLLCERRDRERPVGDEGASGLPLEPASLCVVGDRKQSIYEFRGADVSVFGELAERARRSDGMRLETLSRSYRSLPSLVTFCNQAFAAILGPPGDGVFQVDAPYQVRWLPDEDRLAPVRDPSLVPAIELLDGDGELPAAARRPFEAARVARHIAALLASGRTVAPKGESPRAIRGGDIAILMRAFTAVDVYRHELTRLGIATVVGGGRNFHGAREVRDLAALLLAIADSNDRFASVSVYRSPAGGLSDDALMILAAADALPLSRHAKGCAVSLPAADEQRLNRLGPLVERLSREVDRVGPAGTLRLAIDELDLLPSLAATFDGEQRIANLRKLLAMLERAGGRGAAHVAARLLALADSDTDYEPPADVAAAADPRAVRILTVHAAKGLEFPVVVIPELGAPERNETAAVLFDRRRGLAIRPHDPLGARVSDRHFEEVSGELGQRRNAEAARLFYVAATRARDLLILCGERGKGGNLTFRELLDRALSSLTVPIARPAPPPELPPRERPDPLLFDVPTKEALALVARAAPPEPKAAHLVAAVTDLAALDRCARRYFYRALVGLEEYLQSGSLLGALSDEEADPAALDRLARGTLAHRLLERVDLALAAESPTEAVRRAALAEGLDPTHADLASIAGDASAFLESALGRVVTAKETPRVYRELPFALDVAGPRGGALTVKGKIDLLFVDGEGTINVVDYKHASAKGQPADAFAFQLRTYALAARRVLPGEVALRAGVAWLRDRGAPPAFAPVDEETLSSHADRLAALADRLAEAQRENTWPKLSSRAACEGCGYVPRCWGKSPPQQLTLFGEEPLLEPHVRRRRR